MDKDTFTADDFLCDGTIQLNEVFQTGKQGAWVPLFKEGQRAGEIEIQASFQPIYAPGMGMGMGMGVGYQQQMKQVTTNLFIV